LPSGDIFIVGRNAGVPFIMKWDVTNFETPVIYNQFDCLGNPKNAFNFVLPVVHETFQEVPASYNILQDDGVNLIALIRFSGTNYGYAKFSSNDLSLISITPISQTPSIFDSNRMKVGFIGTGDQLITQVVGMRNPVCNKRLPYVLDAVIQLIDPITFNVIQEINYSDSLGICGTGQIQQASGGYFLNGTSDILLRSELTNLIEITERSTVISQNQIITFLKQNDLIYSLEFANPGVLSLIEYQI
jgi:hypothetical protein